MANNNSYLSYEGLTVYDNKVKELINGKFTNAVGTFAGTASKSLDSSKLEGHAASYFSVATHTHDSSYLGKTATAANASKLGGADASAYAKTVKIGNTSYNAESNIVSLPAYPTLSSLGAASSSSLTAHTGNSTIHITAAERTKWNGYSTAITALQNKDTSLDSSLKVVDSSLKSHLNDNTRHITAAERTRWNNTYTTSVVDEMFVLRDEDISYVKGIANGNTELIKSNTDEINTILDKANTNEKNIDAVASDLTALSGKVTAMGNVFKFKGTKAKKSELPSSGNEIGDVWHVNEDSNEYVYDASSKWELIGSAHTQVSAVASLTSGTKVGTITVDGTTTTLYAPTPITPSITQVSADASLTSGTRIGTISVNNKSTVLYAPSKTSVTVTQNATSGINVGTIDVDGVSKTLYITNPNTDSMVKHTDPGKVTTKFPLLMGKTTGTGTVTEEVYHTPNITVDSSNGALYLKEAYVGSGSGAAQARISTKTAGSGAMLLYCGTNELNIAYYNPAGNIGDMWINYNAAFVGSTPNRYVWATGGGNNGKCASHIVGSIYSAETNIILNNNRGESILSYCPRINYAAEDSIVLGGGSRAITLATDDNSLVYHGTTGGHLYEMWDSKNLNIARGVNLLHGTHRPDTVFTNCWDDSDSLYGKIMVCAYPSDGTKNYIDVVYKKPLKLKNNGVYTISFYVKADSAFTGTTTFTAATGICTHFYNTNQTSSGNLVASGNTSWGVSNTTGDGLVTSLPFTTAWKRVYITYTLTANAEKDDCNPNFILFRIGKGCTHTIYVANIQIEEGVTAPSDYSEVGMGDLAPVNSDICDLGTEGNAWRMIHANGLHLSGMYDGDDGHGSNYGGMIYFGDDYADVETFPNTGKTLTYIGETSDDELHVHAASSLYLEGDNDISLIGDTIITGTCSASGGFFETSDIRKKNILSELPIEKCYELVDKCQEIVYTLKSDPDKERVGMIAQEVECFFPEIVSEGADGYKSLDYAKLSVVCLRLLKDIIEKGGYKPKTFTEKVKSKFKKIFSKR